MNPKLLMALAPLLLRKKRSWLLILLAVGAYFWANRGTDTVAPGVNDGFRMPDLSISQLWKEPRDILVDRVEDARDAQSDTVEEFKTALEKFKEITNFQGGDLEEKYTTLNRSFERCEAAAENIGSRIDKVTDASNALLSEWKSELAQYHDPGLRARAQNQFDDTRRRADEMIDAMRRAKARTKPVLDAFRDQVLYIKHNLNMQAITSLDKEAASIASDVDKLVREMESSIAEANAFIDTLLKSSTG